MTDSRAAVFSEGAPDQLIIRFVKGEELHSSSMVSYRAKGINKFTPVNLRLPDSNRREGIFLLAALVSTGSPPATARLLCSTRSGVECHYFTRRRRRRAFDPPGYRTVTPLRRPPRQPSDGQPEPPGRIGNTSGRSAAKEKTLTEFHQFPDRRAQPPRNASGRH